MRRLLPAPQPPARACLRLKKLVPLLGKRKHVQEALHLSLCSHQNGMAGHIGGDYSVPEEAGDLDSARLPDKFSWRNPNPMNLEPYA